MWLKIVYNINEIIKWPIKLNNIEVLLESSDVAPVTDDLRTFRISPIFSLIPDSQYNSIKNTKIFFYNFENAYRVLGRIEQKGTDQLRRCIFFSSGLSSVILITKNPKVLEEFREISSVKERALEIWEIKSSRIANIEFHIDETQIEINEFKVINYERLPFSERALIDEFKISIKLFLIKMAAHMPSELEKIKKLIIEINSLISELIFLSDFLGETPTSLSEYSIEDLKNKNLSQIIKNQILDRIIQVNSALSFVSTQAFSGAIPILERRSIIRRSSLLGIGSAILALNRISKFIENAFLKIPIDRIIIESMLKGKPLDGTFELPIYDSKDWGKSSVDTFFTGDVSDDKYIKLPYFSGRLGFRETEYSISAAIQSISSGANLEWSLMTLTHEMLHGHVRIIIDSIFFGSPRMKEQENWNLFYKHFEQCINKKGHDIYLIDSIRNIILTYCCFTRTHGSISSKPPNSTDRYNFELPTQKDLWNILEIEHRNISEIFVHILDLDYFYASRISVYIPLIWSSWIGVPQVSGNIRQYMLRSLLTIASKIEDEPYQRFNSAVERFKDLLIKYSDNKLKNPIIEEIIEILGNKDLLMHEYFLPFKASLIIVDLVTKIFTSANIRGGLFTDNYVEWSEDINNFEKAFSYNLPNGFNDEAIVSPIAYLLDRMIKVLNSSSQIDDLERETILQFLAINSKN